MFCCWFHPVIRSVAHSPSIISQPSCTDLFTLPQPTPSSIRYRNAIVIYIPAREALMTPPKSQVSKGSVFAGLAWYHCLPRGSRMLWCERMGVQEVNVSFAKGVGSLVLFCERIYWQQVNIVICGGNNADLLKRPSAEAQKGQTIDINRKSKAYFNRRLDLTGNIEVFIIDSYPRRRGTHYSFIWVMQTDTAWKETNKTRGVDILAWKCLRHGWPRRRRVPAGGAAGAIALIMRA
ncbi:hypothetical protein EVAR_48115_1 [Eumeta japonica]|uniref:Uncharacterized protein n=1 Tax=Eumeta variegata TaxID=151549 RepID=A0A4C2A9G5_EUMVA|nr:hypothetical protein EVAR_48115_1 [Eumeta japonica]